MSTADGMSTVPLFCNLDADHDDGNITEVESLCLACHKQGITRLLLTKIPFFREVIISSFQCDGCDHSDRSIQSAGCIQDKGVQYTLTVINSKDLNRQVIKSEFAAIYIPDIDFEQPSIRNGDVTTVEGLLDSIVSGLLQLQEERRRADAEIADKIDKFIERLKTLKKLEKSFTLIVNDPSGNSFIENPDAPAKDNSLVVLHYERTRLQNIELGCLAEDDEACTSRDSESAPSQSAVSNQQDVFGCLSSDRNMNLQNEVLQFPTNCPICNSPCQTNMKLVDIPYFKQVVIMATVCDVCGCRDNEVKGGSGIEAKGTRITLHITNELDLSRDVLKSDTAAVSMPELQLELVEGTLGGRFTTVEGLLVAIKDQLSKKNPFVSGDSSQDDTRQKIKDFCDQLNQVITGERQNVHLILDDPAGNSYMQNIHAPKDDPELKVEHYERSYAQNELLGVNDMSTDGYS